MTECKCLESTFQFDIYKRVKHTSWFGRNFRSGLDEWSKLTHIVTIHAETLPGIGKRRNEIREELEEKYPKEEYKIYEWIK